MKQFYCPRSWSLDQRIAHYTPAPSPSLVSLVRSYKWWAHVP